MSFRKLTSSTLPPNITRLMTPEPSPEPAKIVLEHPGEAQSERKLQGEVWRFLTDSGYAIGTPQFGRKSTYTIGWPDFTVCINGKFLGIELKTGSGQLTLSQEEIHALLRKNGARVEVCRTLMEAVKVVKEMEGK